MNTGHCDLSVPSVHSPPTTFFDDFVEIRGEGMGVSKAYIVEEKKGQSRQTPQKHTERNG